MLNATMVPLVHTVHAALRGVAVARHSGVARNKRRQHAFVVRNGGSSQALPTMPAHYPTGLTCAFFASQTSNLVGSLP